MCSNHQHHDSETAGQAHNPAALTLRVDDMTCSHCAGTIKRAIETSLPGTQVHADPGSKTVSVIGTDSFSRLQEIVAAAGYTPSTSPV